MVKYKTILSAIEDYVIKCPATQKIRKIGSQGIRTYKEEFRLNEFGDPDFVNLLKKIEYPDGTTLEFDLTEHGLPIITSVKTGDGFQADLLGEKCYQFFQSQKEEIIEKYGPEEWEFMKQYTNSYASKEGKSFNLYKKGLITKEQLLDPEKYNFPMNLTHFLLDNDEHFTNICNDLHLQDYPNFYSLRVARLHDNDGVNKKIVSTRSGHSSATVGDEWEVLNGLHKHDGAWTIVTLYENGNEASTGFFMGNVKTSDFEAEIHTVKGNKFKRKIIDEENKIIIQEPYKP